MDMSRRGPASKTFPDVLAASIERFVVGPVPASLRRTTTDSEETRRAGSPSRSRGSVGPHSRGGGLPGSHALALLPTPPARRRCAPAGDAAALSSLSPRRSKRVLPVNPSLEHRLTKRKDIPTEPLLTESWVGLMVQLEQIHDGLTVAATGTDDATKARHRHHPAHMSLTDLERRELLSAGMSSEHISRLFRALFVYSFGVYECLEDVVAHLEETEKERAVILAWRVYLRLLEQIPRRHSHLLEVFTGADATEDLKHTIEEQEKRHKNMLATQKFLEERAVRAREAEASMADRLAKSDARLGAATARILTQECMVSKMEAWKQDATDRLERKTRENAELLNRAMRVASLQDQVRALTEEARNCLSERKRLTAELSDTTRKLHQCTEDLQGSKFRNTIVTKSRNRLKRNLESTSAQLRVRTQEKADADHTIHGLRKQVRGHEVSIRDAEHRHEHLSRDHEEARMRTEDLWGRLDVVLRTEEEARIARKAKMDAAARAIADRDAQEEKIRKHLETIAQEQRNVAAAMAEIAARKAELQRVHDTALLQAKDLSDRDHRLREAADQIAELKAERDKLCKEMEVVKTMAENDRMMMLEAEQAAKTSAEHAQNCQDRANAADEARRRAAVEYQAIEDGLRLRVDKAQAYLAEQAAEFEMTLAEKQRAIVAMTDRCADRTEELRVMTCQAQTLQGTLDISTDDLRRAREDAATVQERVASLVDTVRAKAQECGGKLEIGLIQVERGLGVIRPDADSKRNKEPGDDTKSADEGGGGGGTAVVLRDVELSRRFLSLLGNRYQHQEKQLSGLQINLQDTRADLKITKTAIARERKVNAGIVSQLEESKADVQRLNETIVEERAEKAVVQKSLESTTTELESKQKHVLELEENVTTLVEKVEEDTRQLEQVKETARVKEAETLAKVTALEEKKATLEETLTETLAHVPDPPPEMLPAETQTELTAEVLEETVHEAFEAGVHEHETKEWRETHVKDVGTDMGIVMEDFCMQAGKGEVYERVGVSIYKGNARSFEPENHPDCEIVTVKSMEPIGTRLVVASPVADGESGPIPIIGREGGCDVLLREMQIKNHRAPDKFVESLLRRAARSRVSGMHSSSDAALFGALWSNRGGAWLLKFQERVLDDPKNVCGFETWDPVSTI